MNRASIYRCAEGSVGAICLLLAVWSLGCAEESPAPIAAAPASAMAVASPAIVAQSKSGGAKTAANVGKDLKAEKAPKGETASDSGTETVQIGACDGGKAVEVPKGLTGQALADNLMDQWKRSHPEAHWVKEEKQRHALKPPADNSGLLKGGQAKGDTYGKYTQRDILIWARETEKFVAEGSRIFHSGDALGSEVSVSCDMCHPHAANTHPETYPKFQVQLGRVALLRDMIEWCIENPVRGKHLEPDGPTMRALEAYILSQRKGTPMDYGKH